MESLFCLLMHGRLLDSYQLIKQRRADFSYKNMSHITNLSFIQLLINYDSMQQISFIYIFIQ